MPKQDHNAGSGTKGPHRQGEKGGKGGTVKRSGAKTTTGERSKNDPDKMEPFSAQTPRMSRKGNSDGKGSGNR